MKFASLCLPDEEILPGSGVPCTVDESQEVGGRRCNPCSGKVQELEENIYFIIKLWKFNFGWDWLIDWLSIWYDSVCQILKVRTVFVEAALSSSLSLALTSSSALSSLWIPSRKFKLKVCINDEYQERSIQPKNVKRVGVGAHLSFDRYTVLVEEDHILGCGTPMAEHRESTAKRI